MGGGGGLRLLRLNVLEGSMASEAEGSEVFSLKRIRDGGPLASSTAEFDLFVHERSSKDLGGSELRRIFLELDRMTSVGGGGNGSSSTVTDASRSIEGKGGGGGGRSGVDDLDACDASAEMVGDKGGTVAALPWIMLGKEIGQRARLAE